MNHYATCLIGRPLAPNVPKRELVQDYIPMFQEGGIGDLILALPFVQLFRQQKTKVRFYTFAPEIAAIFLDWVEIVPRDQLQSDNPSYVIHCIDLIRFKLKHQDAVREMPPFVKKLYDIWLAKQDEWGFLAQKYPHEANLMGKKCENMGLKRWQLATYLVDAPYIKFRWKTYPVVAPQQFITVHDGFDSTGSMTFDASMKSWNMDYWAEFVRLFKINHPDIVVIQLGGKKYRKIEGVDVDLAGILPFAESLRYLNSSLVHIDGDSGLVHARALFDKPSVVIFGSTPAGYFGYEGNKNLETTMKCSPCWWKKGNWMETCYAGHNRPLCMEETKPINVLEAVNSIFERG